MRKIWFAKALILIFSAAGMNYEIFAQEKSPSQMKSQEVSDDDGIPVLIKHLPDWENNRNRVTHTNNTDDLRRSLGERPVFDLIDFAGGTEAVAAPYNEGKLLVVEFSTPQGSVDADNKIKQRLSEIGQNPPIFYRRIGNYNAFVFDANDEAAANVLLDQVKYEKNIQWLGTNPFILRRMERDFITGTSNLFISTVLAIMFCIGLAIAAGIAVGLTFFYIREQNAPE